MRTNCLLYSAPTALAIVFLFVAPSRGQQPFTFDLAGSSGKITLARPADGLIPLRLIYKPAPTATGLDVFAHVTAPSLVGDGNTAAAVRVATTYIRVGSCETPPTHLAADLQVRNNWEPVCLLVNPLAPGKYTGWFLVTASTVDPKTRETKNLDMSLTQLEISEVPPAALTATHMTVSQPSPIKLTLPVFGFNSGQADLYATLREKEGKADVAGLAVSMDVFAAPSSFDRSQVTTYLGRDQTDLFTSEPNRKILAGQQVDVRLALGRLEAGDYTIAFKFTGTNAPSDDSQKITAQVHVRDHWLWPMLSILAATFFSFLANKVIAAKRRRAALLEKIGGLRPAWLDEFADSQPVVWVRAMLSQAEDLSSRYWLTSPDTIEARVNMVANVLKVLDEARRLRERLDDGLDFLVFRRVVQSLERLVERIGAGALDDISVGKFETDMAAFEDWLNKDRYPLTLWGQILPEIQQVQAEIAANPGATPTVAEFVAANTALTASLASPPSTTSAANAAYRNYVILSILWSCRNNAETLAQCAGAGGDVLKLFDIVDRLDWETLKEAPLTIQFPTNSNPDGIEAFSPLTFSIIAGGAPVEKSYLFRHNMSVNWRIQLEPESRRLRRTPKPITLTPKILGPSVMQYFPFGGTVHASAELSYRGNPHPVNTDEKLVIEPSREFGVMKGFERAELLGWLVATAIALASGLSIYYLPALGWGSFKDYMTLFLWGAVGDQGRNFIQASTGISK
jgi:hypothetical protein